MSIENLKNINENIRDVYLKQEFFEFVDSGLKTLELRVAFSSFFKISIGDKIRFKSGQGASVEVEITDIRQYSEFAEVLQSEDISKLAPNITDQQIQKISTSLFKESDVKQYGLILFEFKKIE